MVGLKDNGAIAGSSKKRRPKKKKNVNINISKARGTTERFCFANT